MPNFNPKEVQEIIERVEKRIDNAVSEAYTGGIEIIKEAYGTGVEYGNKDLKPRGVYAIPPDPNELAFLDQYNFDLIKGLGDDIKKDVKRVIRDGLINGKGMNQVASDLKKVLRVKKARLNTIARTEVMRAANYGRLKTWERSGVVKGKEWLTAFDDRTCSICSDLDGERRRIDEAFSIGVMMPPAHPNCRCTAVPVFIDETLANNGPDPREIPSKKLELAYSRVLWNTFNSAIKGLIEELTPRWGP